jgi:hypothetical protein
MLISFFGYVQFWDLYWRGLGFQTVFQLIAKRESVLLKKLEATILAFQDILLNLSRKKMAQIRTDAFSLFIQYSQVSIDIYSLAQWMHHAGI